MLALSVMEDERVIIHRDGEVICEVMLLRGETGKAKLGFDADASIGVDRVPVFEAKFTPSTAENKPPIEQRSNQPRQP